MQEEGHLLHASSIDPKTVEIDPVEVRALIDTEAGGNFPCLQFLHNLGSTLVMQQQCIPAGLADGKRIMLLGVVELNITSRSYSGFEIVLIVLQN